ncbi:MAG: aminotransferase class IV family protein [Bacteroidia bacterium]
MYPLIESIKVSDGRFQNLSLHNARLNKSRRELWACKDEIDIAESVVIPGNVVKGIYKCTVTYGKTITNIQFQPYAIRKINSLKLVADNTIDYSYKYANRDCLNKLLEQKEGCDEIIIVKHKMLTDTSFSNIAMYDGKKWLTPVKPLLKGTKREELLQQGLIAEAEISISDLKNFNKLSLINAMLDLGDIVIAVNDLR